MASTPLFNSSNLDELFVLDIDDKIIDDKSPKSRDNDQKQSSIIRSRLVDSCPFKKEHRRKMWELILEKSDDNVNIPHITKK